MKKLIAAAMLGVLGLAGGWAEKVDVYLGTQGRGESKGIYLSELDTETGALSAPKLAVEVAGPGFLVLSKDGKSLYSTARTPGQGGERGMDAVAWFRVQEDGMLKLGDYESSRGKRTVFRRAGCDGEGPDGGELREWRGGVLCR